jgi:hypothetical protein
MAAREIKFGVVLEINGKLIPLEPVSAINKIKQEGIEVGLPPGMRVDLGEIGDTVDEVIKIFDDDWGTAPNTVKDQLASTDLPDPVQAIANKLLSARFAVEALHMKMKPTAPDGSGTWEKKYTLGMSLTWDPNATSDDAKPPELAGVGLRGIYLTFTNEEGGPKMIAG